MSGNGETARGTTGWTVESVLDHVNTALRDQKERFKEGLEAQEKKNQQQFADADKAVRAAMAAAEKAVEKAEQNAEKWRANANEWRAAMSDRERNFAPVQRLDSFEKAHDEQKEDLNSIRRTELEARTALRSELMQEISGLRESRSEGAGEKQSRLHEVAQRQWLVSLAVAIGTSAVTALIIQLVHR
jgi:hypothetical protein